MRVERLFVYGTLKPGRSRWPSLAPFADPDEPVVAAEIVGALWATPWGWPALTPGQGTVRGVVIALRRESVPAALSLLDQIEGVDCGLFARVPTTTREGTPCSVYRWRAGTDGFVPLSVNLE